MSELPLNYEWLIADSYNMAIHFRRLHEEYMEDPNYNGMFLITAESYEKLAQDLEQLKENKHE